MSDQRTSVTLRNEHVAVVEVIGELTSESEEHLTEVFAGAIEGGPRRVVLDFGGLEYMNSSGIGLLVTLLIRANRGGHELVACGLNDHYRQIFTLTRLDEAIACFETQEEAVRTR